MRPSAVVRRVEVVHEAVAGRGDLVVPVRLRRLQILEPRDARLRVGHETSRCLQLGVGDRNSGAVFVHDAGGGGAGVCPGSADACWSSCAMGGRIRVFGRLRGVNMRGFVLRSRSTRCGRGPRCGCGSQPRPWPEPSTRRRPEATTAPFRASRPDLTRGDTATEMATSTATTASPAASPSARLHTLSLAETVNERRCRWSWPGPNRRRWRRCRRRRPERATARSAPGRSRPTRAGTPPPR